MTDHEPTMKLGKDLEIPAVGFGTYLIDNDAAEPAVTAALEVGYRHIDTAEAYRNEDAVGKALRRFFEHSGCKRDEVFVTTKVFPGNDAWGTPVKGYNETLAALDASLKRLGLDHVDLYLIHAPFAGERRIEQWKALIEARRLGKTRAIGVSNWSEAHIGALAAARLPLPDANQIELHPWSQKPALVSFLAANGIRPIAYSSLVPLSTWRTAEGQGSAKTDAMRKDGERDDFPFRRMAEKYGVSEAQVLLRWGVQQGYPVLPKSTNPERIKRNRDLFGFTLDHVDMDAIDKLDRGAGVAWSGGDPLDAS
jgi:2,5-diketo-D-gluconate reductase A